MHAPARKASMTPTPATPTNQSKNDLRSAKTDGVQIDVTGDKTRDKCMELIYDALASDSGARELSILVILYRRVRRSLAGATTLAPDQILKRAKGIESSILSLFDSTNQAYKSKIRSLYVNLKDKNNPGLRENIVSGDISVDKFCKMSSEVKMISFLLIMYD
jgi:transcription elongation factor S-II